MAKRNHARRRTQKKERLKEKNKPPIALIATGVGIILLGFAALLLLQNGNSSANAGGAPGEYSSIPVEVEYEAPELTLTNLSGEEESLADYHGQVVLVNLWATWCPPCKEELPVLQAYYETYKDEGFVILGIDSQEPAEDVQNFIETTNIAKITYPIWIDERGDAGLAFSSFSLPASFVIDREGTVRLAWTGAISGTILEEHVTPVIRQ